MQMPKAASSPVDPEKASFLTKLPAEMRNIIYELLFKKDEPVLLHNTKAFHPKEPTQLEWPHAEDYSRHKRIYFETYEEDAGLDEEFSHNFCDGINLLLTCRQLHNEASGVLYSQNTFIISRVLGRHDFTDRYGPLQYDNLEYFPPMYAARWLSSLGSQVGLLHKVIIDIDAMCPLHCAYSMKEYNLLPLIHFMWSNPMGKNVVTFGQSGRVLDHTRFQPRDLPEEETCPVHRANTLNNLLAVFVNKDTLRLRRFHTFNRLLQSIEIPNASEEGYVTFKSPYRPPYTLRQHFTVSSQGRRVEWAPRKRPKFTNLPPEIVSRIYEFACYNPDGITFDLDTCTAHGLNIGLFHWVRSVRSNTDLARNVSHVNHVTIKATSNTVITDFNDFGHLPSLLYKPYAGHRPGLFEYMIMQASTDCKPLTVLLGINAPHAATLSEVRINIDKLMDLLQEYKCHPKATFKVTLTCPSGWKDETSISIAKLQRQLFLLLSDMISEMRKSLLTAQPTPAFPSSPREIWINGHGKPVNVSYPDADISCAYRHGHLTQAEIEVLGSHRSIALSKTESQCRYPFSLRNTWNALREIHWPDWKERSANLDDMILPDECDTSEEIDGV